MHKHLWARSRVNNLGSLAHCIEPLLMLTMSTLLLFFWYMSESEEVGGEKEGIVLYIELSLGYVVICNFLLNVPFAPN